MEERRKRDILLLVSAFKSLTYREIKKVSQSYNIQKATNRGMHLWTIEHTTEATVSNILQFGLQQTGVYEIEDLTGSSMK